jgi:hypothetical protein
VRNALICAGTMLAILMLWPIAFGGGSSAVAAQPRSTRVTMIVPPAPAPLPTPEEMVAAEPIKVSLPAPGTETCTTTYHRMTAQCTSDGCKLRAADGLDICQGTGFWPS